MFFAVAVTMDSIMKPVLGTPQGTGVGPIGGMATQTPTAKIFLNFWFCWCLSTSTKPRGLTSPSMPRKRFDAAEGRQHHRHAERQFARRLDGAVVGDFLDDHLAALDLFHARAGHPLDVLVAHRAFEQSLGVADAVEPEMADIGLRRHEGHRHLVADLAAAQLRFEDEGEFIGRPVAGRALHRAGDDRPRLLAEFLEAQPGLFGMIDMADRTGEAVGAEALDLVEGEFGAGGDDQIIVAERRAVLEFEPVGVGIDLGDREPA